MRPMSEIIDTDNMKSAQTEASRKNKDKEFRQFAIDTQKRCDKQTGRFILRPIENGGEIHVEKGREEITHAGHDYKLIKDPDGYEHFKLIINNKQEELEGIF